MLKVNIIAIGSLKEKYLRSAQEEYVKRLSRFVTLQMIELPEAPLPEKASAAQIQSALEKEGTAILARVKPTDRKIALCVEGKALSSEEYATLFEQTALSGVGTVDLIIGSSHGLSEQVKRACDRRLSFSKMTFPHQLMRVILLEQTYRAFKIIMHEPYHK